MCLLGGIATHSAAQLEDSCADKDENEKMAVGIDSDNEAVTISRVRHPDNERYGE